MSAGKYPKKTGTTKITEKVKRLSPKIGVLRELYFKSGNQCAFPDCDRRVMNPDGVYIAELCHIEAAEVGWARFNPSQTNEQRRAFSNLMLMCHEHHVITNDEKKYPVAKLQKMKAKHEARFTDVAGKILAAIKDCSMVTQARYPKTLDRVRTVMSWYETDGDIPSALEEIQAFIDKLKKLPVGTRQFLTVALQRAHPHHICGSRSSLAFLSNDVQEATELPISRARSQVHILLKYGLISRGIDDDLGLEQLEFDRLPGGWDVWKDLRRFASKTKKPLGSFIEDLRFDQLD